MVEGSMVKLWFLFILLTVPLWMLSLSYISEPLNTPALATPFSLLSNLMMLPSPKGWASLYYVGFIAIGYVALLLWGIYQLLRLATAITPLGAVVLAGAFFTVLMAPLNAQQWHQTVLRQRAIVREQAVERSIREKAGTVTITVQNRRFVTTPYRDYTALRYTLLIEGRLNRDVSYAIGDRLCADGCSEIYAPSNVPEHQHRKDYGISLRLWYGRDTQQWTNHAYAMTDSVFYTLDDQGLSKPYAFVTVDLSQLNDGHGKIEVQIPFHTEIISQIKEHQITLSASDPALLGKLIDSATLETWTWTINGRPLKPPA
jgi:hypothetical protein